MWWYLGSRLVGVAESLGLMLAVLACCRHMNVLAAWSRWLEGERGRGSLVFWFSRVIHMDGSGESVDVCLFVCPGVAFGRWRAVKVGDVRSSVPDHCIRGIFR